MKELSIFHDKRCNQKTPVYQRYRHLHVFSNRDALIEHDSRRAWPSESSPQLWGQARQFPLPRAVPS